MIRPRLRGRCLWFAVLASPLLAWGIVLICTPMGWLKARLITRLEAETGRAVQIDSVQLGWTGNLQITNLSFAERQTPADPWLRVGTAKIDVHLGQALVGCCQPGDIEVDVVTLRIWRRQDGRFEFGDLAQIHPSADPSQTQAARSANFCPGLNFRVAHASVQLIDEANDLRLDLSGAEARGSYRAHAVKIDDLRGHLNGGPITLAALLIRDPLTPRFAIEIRAKRVHLNQGLRFVETFVPLVARSDDALSGFLNVRLALKGQGASCGEIRRTTTGHGSILLDPIDLAGSRILSELQALGEWPKEGHVGAVSANFTIEAERVATEDLTIRASKMPFVVACWTDFDGRFAYTTQVDKMIASLPREARSWLSELKVNLDELTGLRIAGKRGQVQLTLNGRPLSSDPNQPSAERTRYRATARKIRDRFFR